MWKENKKDFSYKIDLKQLISGVSKEYVFELEVPPVVNHKLSDFNRNAEVLNAVFKANPIG